jgi:predicted RNA-binding Zn-ribbon protein involved in translation (DUF1610 family)
VPPRLCPRCHADLPTEDTGELTYCPHCGAAQIILSEELREQFEQQQLTAPPSSDDASTATLHSDSTEPPITDPAAIAWPRALQLVALAGAAFAAAMVLTLALPPLVLVLLLWMLGAPIILLGIYCAKNPTTRVTTGFGARLGLLSGLSVGIVFMTVDILGMFVQRFLLHKGAELDAQFAASLEQARSMFAQLNPSDPSAFQRSLDLLKVPEFHAGFALAGCAAVIAVYAIYSTATGAFSGALRSRSAKK